MMDLDFGLQIIPMRIETILGKNLFGNASNITRGIHKRELPQNAQRLKKMKVKTQKFES